MLVLFDNCEHVIGAVADLAHRLLTSCPGVTILATSREALGIPGETVFQVPSLGLPRSDARTERDEYEAVTADLRSRLDGPTLSAEWASGRSMEMLAAVDFAVG